MKEKYSLRNQQGELHDTLLLIDLGMAHQSVAQQ